MVCEDTNFSSAIALEAMRAVQCNGSVRLLLVWTRFFRMFNRRLGYETVVRRVSVC